MTFTGFPIPPIPPIPPIHQVFTQEFQAPAIPPLGVFMNPSKLHDYERFPSVIHPLRVVTRGNPADVTLVPFLHPPVPATVPTEPFTFDQKVWAAVITFWLATWVVAFMIWAVSRTST